MAVTPVRASTKGRSAAASTTTSFGTLPTAGNAVVVIAWCWNGSAVGSCSDNQGVGNVYSLKRSQQNVGMWVAEWECASIGATSGTFTVTCGFTSATVVVAGAEEVSALSGTVDQSTGQNGSASNPASGTTATTTQADDLSISSCVTDANTNASGLACTGYTEIVREIDNTNWQSGAGHYKIRTTTGTESASWTGASGNYGAQVVVYKGGAGGGGAQDTPELYGRPFGSRGANQMRQLIVQ